MNSDWAGLPNHLLDLILEKLEASKDYLHFGVVCLPWHYVIKDNQSTQNKKPYHHQLPLLLIPCEEDDHTWSIYDVMDNKFLELKLMTPYDRRFCGSSEGWLMAVNKDWTITLYQPYSSFIKDGDGTADTSIHLPCLFPPILEGFVDNREIYDYHVQKAIITADPVTNPNECTVVVIFGEWNELAFIRIAKDTKWTKIDREDYTHAEDTLHYNNQLYLVNYHGALVSVVVTDSCISTVNLVAPEIPNYESTNVKRYIVNSYGGELLQVERHFLCDWSDGIGARVTTKFKIFRMDFDKRRWNEINSLGDITLFLGDNSSISVLASKFTGCEPNCIYFTHDIDIVHNSLNPIICDLGMYDVQNGSFKLHYAIDLTALSKMTKRPPIWVVPAINA